MPGMYGGMSRQKTPNTTHFNFNDAARETSGGLCLVERVSSRPGGARGCKEHT